MSPTEEVACLVHKYGGVYENDSIFITISSASYNNLLSYSGKLNGFTQYKSDVCPVTGTFKLTGQGTFSISLYESGKAQSCTASYDGTIKCYSNETDFDGEAIVAGELGPLQIPLKLISVD